MKRTLMIVLAGLMMFAFTQCGGSGNVKGTKQFTDVKKMYNELEKTIKDAKTCDELEDAAFGIVFGYLAVELSDNQYTEEERITEKEKEQLKSIAENVVEIAKKKAAKLGCDFDWDE